MSSSEPSSESEQRRAELNEDTGTDASAEELKERFDQADPRGRTDPFTQEDAPEDSSS